MKEPYIIRMLDLTIKENMSNPVLVEGEHDVSALRELGFTGEIIKINNGLSLPVFCQYVAERTRRVIILVDFDRKGISIEEKISTTLESLGCSVSDTMWRYIRKNYKIKSVEDLPYLIRKTIWNPVNKNHKSSGKTG